MRHSHICLLLACLLTLSAHAQTHYFVDLGLPSGVCWATTNVGATIRSDNGDFYQWGGLSTQFSSGYNLSFDLENGIMPLSQDIAHTQWGGYWCIPTSDNWQELLKYCDVTEITVNGKSGHLFTSKIEGYTDRSIFLPYAGYKNMGSQLNEDKEYNYWSATPHSSDASKGYSFYSRGTSASITLYYKGLGFTIRPVYIVLRNISLSATTIAPGADHKLSINSVPSRAVISNQVWTIDDPSVATVSQDGTIHGVRTGTTTVHVSVNDGEFSAQTIISVVQSSIDMGLSVRWADRNIGANAPTEIGNYYMWGAVTPYDANFNQYYHKDENLPAGRDVANYSYGEGWRMPTDDEWEELVNACSWSKQSIDGHICMVGTPKQLQYASQRIILPCTGYYSSAILYSSSTPEYWTSVWAASNQAVLYSFPMANSDNTWKPLIRPRDNGLPVRAVLTSRTHPLVPVDMGNGIYWADANIGAFEAYDPGYYFAWGDLEGSRNGVHDFTWERYLYSGSDYNTLSKYNSQSSLGDLDGLTTLADGDDVARHQLGDGWRMPTPEEIATLEDRSLYTWTWFDADNTEYLGHAGYRVTSKQNGNSIFLPATGFFVSNHIEGQNQLGAYWTTERHPDVSYQAALMCFDAVDCCTGYGLRCEGRVIRPVKTIQ